MKLSDIKKGMRLRLINNESSGGDTYYSGIEVGDIGLTTSSNEITVTTRTGQIREKRITLQKSADKWVLINMNEKLKAVRDLCLK